MRSQPNLDNQALAAYLAAAGSLAQPAAIALDTYEQICCLAGTVADLTRLGMLLVMPPLGLDPAHCRVVTAIMSTCGLYEYSGQFAVTAGVPCKSGVSGALVAIVPGQGVIAGYSPPLDRNGNSVAGIWLVQQLATTLRLSMFYRDVGEIKRIDLSEDWG
ncbi:glutaminase [Trichothermofontia sichuanensis B231]|uniref:glutaminase n=1 Tax=Trichothermofontia sichuanensis TaxID=3045816 RepID=UPI0022457079|nr:glutaminase [Trichothermofontia sichuanensis]UZQ54264.1 glutaminase [Trichothermofontia sichuanensis B231]